jgi:cell division septation protein DedD
MYTVQIAALQSASAADELMRLLHAAGYPEVRVVQEGGFLKVRVGRFARRGDAAALVPELARKFGGTPFVAEER